MSKSNENVHPCDELLIRLEAVRLQLSDISSWAVQACERISEPIDRGPFIEACEEIDSIEEHLSDAMETLEKR